MANPLSIYSGPAQVSIYDATNDVLHLGYLKQVEVSGEPQTHELMDGNIHQYATLYKFSAQMVQSNQNLMSAIQNRRSTKQEIVVVGLESLVRIKNVFPSVKVVRPFKGAADAHIMELLAQTSVEGDVTLYENLLASDGTFETDSNSDGLADGWVLIGSPTASLVASFLSGGGNAQRLVSAAANDGMQYDVLMPFEEEVQVAFSIYAKNNETTTESITLFVELLDDNGVSQALYTQSASFAANENKRVSLTQSIKVSTPIKTVRVGVKIAAASVTFDFDNAQLELGGLTDFKSY